MLASPLNDHLKIRAEELDGGRVRLSMDAGPEWLNEVGLLHGGLMALLIDGAGGRAAVRTLALGERCATVHLSVQYLKAGRAGRITAEAWIVQRGRRIAFLEGECRGEDGTVLARATGTWSILAA